jgi:guanine nucleotide-binding protein alpha-1 subunit
MDVKVIIFLAPISVFDERQGEGGINRLEDSMRFWTSICKSKLLIKVIRACSPLAVGGTDEPCHVL